MTSPRVLFLDEPTSGLDSFTANEVRDGASAVCLRKPQNGCRYDPAGTSRSHAAGHRTSKLMKQGAVSLSYRHRFPCHGPYHVPEYISARDQS